MDRPLVLGCSICRGSCDGTPRTEQRLGVTRCGHLFHIDCVRHWWETQARRGHPSRCPLCNSPAHPLNLREVFPSFQQNTSFVGNLDTSRVEQQRADQVRHEETVQKLVELQEKVTALTAERDGAIHKLHTLQDELTKKQNEAENSELRAMYSEESLEMYIQSYDMMRVRMDELYQKNDQLQKTLVTRTKSLLEKIRANNSNISPSPFQ